MTNDILQQGRAIVATWDASTREAARHFLSADLSLEDLYERLGEDALGAGAMRDDLGAAGQRAYKKVTAAIQQKLCGNPELRAFSDPVHADTGDAISLLAVVASLIGDTTGNSINSLLVAALILRIGIRRLCEKA